MAILMIAVATVSKIIGIMIPCWYMKVPTRMGGVIAVLMSCKGLVALIIVNYGITENIISPRFFAILVLMVLVTTMQTVPLVLLVDPPSRAKKSAEEVHAWEEAEARAAEALADAQAAKAAARAAAKAARAGAGAEGGAGEGAGPGLELVSKAGEGDVAPLSDEGEGSDATGASSGLKVGHSTSPRHRAGGAAPLGAEGAATASSAGLSPEGVAVAVDGPGVHGAAAGRPAHVHAATHDGAVGLSSSTSFGAGGTAATGAGGAGVGGLLRTISRSIRDRTRSVVAVLAGGSAGVGGTGAGGAAGLGTLSGVAEDDDFLPGLPEVAEHGEEEAEGGGACFGAAVGAGGGFARGEARVARLPDFHVMLTVREPAMAKALVRVVNLLPPVLEGTALAPAAFVPSAAAVAYAAVAAPAAAPAATAAAASDSTESVTLSPEAPGGTPPVSPPRRSARGSGGAGPSTPREHGAAAGPVAATPAAPPGAAGDAEGAVYESDGEDTASEAGLRATGASERAPALLLPSTHALQVSKRTGAAGAARGVALVAAPAHAAAASHTAITLAGSPAPAQQQPLFAGTAASAAMLGGAAATKLTLTWVLDSMEMPSSYMNFTDRLEDVRDVNIHSAMDLCRLSKGVQLSVFPSNTPLADACDDARARKSALMVCSYRLLRDSCSEHPTSAEELSALLSDALNQERPCYTAIYFDYASEREVTTLAVGLDASHPASAEAALFFARKVDAALDTLLVCTGFPCVPAGLAGAAAAAGDAGAAADRLVHSRSGEGAHSGRGRNRSSAQGAALEGAVARVDSGGDAGVDRGAAPADGGMAGAAAPSRPRSMRHGRETGTLASLTALAPVPEMPTIGTFANLLKGASEADIAAYQLAVQAALAARRASHGSQGSGSGGPATRRSSVDGGAADGDVAGTASAAEPRARSRRGSAGSAGSDGSASTAAAAAPADAELLAAVSRSASGSAIKRPASSSRRGSAGSTGVGGGGGGRIGRASSSGGAGGAGALAVFASPAATGGGHRPSRASASALATGVASRAFGAGRSPVPSARLHGLSASAAGAGLWSGGAGAGARHQLFASLNGGGVAGGNPYSGSLDFLLPPGFAHAYSPILAFLSPLPHLHMPVASAAAVGAGLLSPPSFPAAAAAALASEGADAARAASADAGSERAAVAAALAAAGVPRAAAAALAALPQPHTHADAADAALWPLGRANTYEVVPIPTEAGVAAAAAAMGDATGASLATLAAAVAAVPQANALTRCARLSHAPAAAAPVQLVVIGADPHDYTADGSLAAPAGPATAAALASLKHASATAAGTRTGAEGAAAAGEGPAGVAAARMLHHQASDSRISMQHSDSAILRRDSDAAAVARRGRASTVAASMASHLQLPGWVGGGAGSASARARGRPSEAAVQALVSHLVSCMIGCAAAHTPVLIVLPPSHAAGEE
jgi:hypothetical protein